MFLRFVVVLPLSSVAFFSWKISTKPFVWENSTFPSLQFFFSNQTLCIGSTAHKTNPLKKGLCKHNFTNHSPSVFNFEIYIMKATFKFDWCHAPREFGEAISVLNEETARRRTCSAAIDLNNKGIKVLYLCACFAKPKLLVHVVHNSSLWLMTTLPTFTFYCRKFEFYVWCMNEKDSEIRFYDFDLFTNIETDDLWNL